MQCYVPLVWHSSLEPWERTSTAVLPCTQPLQYVEIGATWPMSQTWCRPVHPIHIASMTNITDIRATTSTADPSLLKFKGYRARVRVRFKGYSILWCCPLAKMCNVASATSLVEGVPQEWKCDDFKTSGSVEVTLTSTMFHMKLHKSAGVAVRTHTRRCSGWPSETAWLNEVSHSLGIKMHVKHQIF